MRSSFFRTNDERAGHSNFIKEKKKKGLIAHGPKLIASLTHHGINKIPMDAALD